MAFKVEADRHTLLWLFRDKSHLKLCEIRSALLTQIWCQFILDQDKFQILTNGNRFKNKSWNLNYIWNSFTHFDINVKSHLIFIFVKSHFAFKFLYSMQELHLWQFIIFQLNYKHWNIFIQAQPHPIYKP